MGVIDADPDLLARRADASLHAARQATIHMDAEVVGDVPALVETLAPHGPYAYAIKPEIHADGSISIPLATTRDDIRDWYARVRGESDLLPERWSVIEVRAEWYTFQETITHGSPKGADTVYETETIALLPVTTAGGITGELVWFRSPRDMLGAPGDAPMGSASSVQTRKDALELHDAYVAALRAADVDGVLRVHNDGAEVAVRDYVDDTGTLVALRDDAARRAHYEAFFARYQVMGIELLERVVQEWYVFAEARWQLADRSRADAPTAFHTAEFMVLANDGRFIARVGHGTDPA